MNDAVRLVLLARVDMPSGATALLAGVEACSLVRAARAGSPFGRRLAADFELKRTRGGEGGSN